MTMHTKGPWSAIAVCPGVTADIGGLPTSICTMDYQRHSLPQHRICRDESVANARLIAAAPDLLAALEGILALGNAEIERPLTMRSGWQKVESDIRAAIAKAKGVTS